MSVSVFLSHTKSDKPFVRELAKDLDNHGIKCWLDEAEIKIGQPLIETIRQSIDEVDYVVVVLSPDSVASSWVQREVEEAISQEKQGRVKVLPLMYRTCDPPSLLLGKVHADFTDDSRYTETFKRLVESMDIVFNKRALEPSSRISTLGHAIDQAVKLNLRLLSKPFHRPFQYIGMSVSDAAKATGHAPNEVGNIVIDTDDCHMLLEAEGNIISYIDIELKKTAPHYQNQEFDSEPILGALSISPGELDAVSKQTHCHSYYDHRKRLKLDVSCLYDEGPLSVGIGTKYYGM